MSTRTIRTRSSLIYWDGIRNLHKIRKANALNDCPCPLLPNLKCWGCHGRLIPIQILMNLICSDVDKRVSHKTQEYWRISLYLSSSRPSIATLLFAYPPLLGTFLNPWKCLWVVLWLWNYLFDFTLFGADSGFSLCWVLQLWNLEFFWYFGKFCIVQTNCRFMI